MTAKCRRLILPAQGAIALINGPLNYAIAGSLIAHGRSVVRKLIGFDDDTYQALVHLGRDRMGTLQELAAEAFADLLKKHNVPIDLKDALRRSADKGSSRARKRKRA